MAIALSEEIMVGDRELVNLVYRSFIFFIRPILTKPIHLKKNSAFYIASDKAAISYPLIIVSLYADYRRKVCLN